MRTNGVPAAETFSPVQKKSGMAERMIASARHLSSVLPADGNRTARNVTKIFFLIADSA
jgi:hypothetical protein